MFKNIKLIGTSHISQDSIKEIKKGMDSFKPDIVAVELDIKRYHSLISRQKNNSIPPIFKIGITGTLFLLIGRFIQKKLGSVVGIDPGSEMKKAIELAQKNNLELRFIDRDIQITLKRFSQEFTWKDKLRIIKDLIKAPFMKKSNIIKNYDFDLTKVPDEKLIEKLVSQLKEKYPSIHKTLIDERDKYMAKKLFKLRKNNPEKKILFVFGAGHKQGLKKYYKELYYSNP